MKLSFFSTVFLFNTTWSFEVDEKWIQKVEETMDMLRNEVAQLKSELRDFDCRGGKLDSLMRTGSEDGSSHLSMRGERHRQLQNNFAKKGQLRKLEAKVDDYFATWDARLACIDEASSTTELRFVGCNVVVLNGQGSSNRLNGFGNLIVGYNEQGTSCPGGQCTRFGSHNIVVGRNNDYNSHSGLVAGESNLLNNQFAFIAGGQQNRATGQYSSVSGGYRNSATDIYTSILGGQDNTASTYASAIVGGSSNTANGDPASTVLGGFLNEASGPYSSVSGGTGNRATAPNSTIAGGDQNEATGANSAVLGGYLTTARGRYGTVLGGDKTFGSDATFDISP